MPPYLPFHLPIIYLIEAFEIIFGLMLLFRKKRIIAGWELIFLLIVVFPADIYRSIKWCSDKYISTI